MTTSKQPSEWPEGIPKPPSDLERNPGIGQSKGAFRTGEDPETLEADNTVEGDTENGTTAAGGIAKRDEARTNK